MQHYWLEFLPLMLVFSLALISPGPDFALILRQALVQGRRAALMSTVGIGTAMLLHVSYTILGLGVIIARSLLLFNIIKWAGVIYLLYLGLKALTSKRAPTILPTSPLSPQQETRNSLKAFLMGFAINLLNPKAVVFFLSIFSSLVAATTPMTIKLSYGLAMAGTTMIWFMLVSLFMTMPTVRRAFMLLSSWIDRISGLVFLALGVRLIFQKPS